MREAQQQLLPVSFYAGLSGAASAGTYVWGYNVDGRGVQTPGHSIEAQQGTPTIVTFTNSLPLPSASELRRLLSIDQTIHWADPLNEMGSRKVYSGPLPAVPHLHGGEVLSDFDGGPEAWFTPDGRRGPDYRTLAGVTTPTNGAVYQYQNSQPATTLWFHDHSLGTIRISVLAGLAAFYLVRDRFDTGLATNPLGLPAGAQEIELMIQDRQFDTNGQLYFPDGSSPFGLNGDPTNPGVHPFWIPEFFGDAILVNGKTWPYQEVEPRRYRFRLVNASNARMYELRLLNRATSAAGPTFWQIGTDGALLDKPVPLNDPANPNAPRLFIAPGERADIIIDFASFRGQTLTLVNSAKAPFPSGTSADPQTTGQVMQFRVTRPLSSRDTTFDPASVGFLRGGNNQPPAIVRLSDPTTGRLAPGVQPARTRQLVLVEAEGPGGPIEVLLNNSTWNGVRDGTATPIPGSQSDGHGGWITELPRVGSTEVWEIVNTTADAHPIHVHLVQFQLVNRQNYNNTQFRKLYDSLFPGGTYAGLLPDGTWGSATYAAGTFIPGYGPPLPYDGSDPRSSGAYGGNPDVSPFLQGQPRLPDPNEIGWKDTIKAFPGQVTRVVLRWAPQATPVNGVAPGQSLYAFDPTSGPGYVWHCHILDHEDNEMMRPYHVTA